LKVNTKDYGMVDVDERQKIVFPDGLIGEPFKNLREYVLLDGLQQPYYILQSLESAATAFVLIDPFLFRPDYEMDISDEDLALIGIKSPEDVLCFSVLTIPVDDGPMTANLRGPIVINRHTHFAMQVILSNPKWGTRHDVLRELADSKKVPC
jgi:flagellar assembly factor FliW